MSLFTKQRVNFALCLIAGACIYFSSLHVFAIEPPPCDPKTALTAAIENPEYMLTHWIELDVAPASSSQKVKNLSLREAILLALRYNPNIQNAELDRIIQRYQLRLAHNEFELQFALAGEAAYMRSRYSGLGSASNQTVFGTPEVGLKTKVGTTMSLKMDNNYSNAPNTPNNYNNYNNNYIPQVSFSLNQPLLRGFGKNLNNAALLNAIDNEFLNKINLQQTVMDQITDIIFAYRALIVSSNNLQNQRHQLAEAKNFFNMNEKKIEAGQLEPTANIQASYQIESLSLMVEQAANEFKTSAQNLLQMIGLDPAIKLAVPDNVSTPKLVIPNVQQSIDIALAHNSQYLAQKILCRADERAYQIAKNQQLWQLDLGASVDAGKTTEAGGVSGLQGIFNGQNTNEVIRLRLNIPLRDISRRSELINAKVRLEKDRITMIAMKRALITNISNIISTIQSQAKRYELAEKQVKLAIQAYDLEKKKQQAGISSSLDVNSTQNQLLQAQAGLISAKIAYLNEISSLERLLGTTLQAWNIKLGFGSCP